MDVFIAFIHDLLLVFYCVFSAEEKMELHAVQEMLQCCQSQCGWCVDEIQWGGRVSVVCYLEFSSLMACKKKLSRVLLVLVLMLWYRLPDGSSEKSSWLSWQESLMIFRVFLTHRWV